MVVGEEASLAGHGQETGNGLCIYAMAAKRPYAVSRNQKKTIATKYRVVKVVLIMSYFRKDTQRGGDALHAREKIKHSL
jgi:hypothetical protein